MSWSPLISVSPALFQVPGCGIDSMAPLLESFGYTRRDLLHFPAKKLRAYWFSPPPADVASDVAAKLAQITGFQGAASGQDDSHSTPETTSSGTQKTSVPSSEEKLKMEPSLSSITTGPSGIAIVSPSAASSATQATWHGPLPRIFVSELLVEQMSPEVREIVEGYTRAAAPMLPHAVALCAMLGRLPWLTPTKEHYDRLAE